MWSLYIFLALFSTCNCDKSLFDDEGQQCAQELEDLKHNHRVKRGITDHYEDSHCLENFETSERTIIRTQESQTNGAVFLNETDLDTYEQCLRACCETPLCNVAIFDQQTGSCFLFDCGPPLPEEFKCRFTANDAFTSGALELNRHAFEISRWGHQAQHSGQLSNLAGDENVQVREEGCTKWEFTCGNGECIAIYDVCNGIPQCVDGTDESPQNCPSTTTVTTPARPSPRRAPAPKPAPQVTRPPDVNQWGREGEKYSPYVPHHKPPQQQQPQVQQQQQQQQVAPNGGYTNQIMQQGSPFQHRGISGVQVPPQPQWNGQIPRYGYDYTNGGFGYQQQPPQLNNPQGYYPQAGGYYYPQQPGMVPGQPQAPMTGQNPAVYGGQPQPVQNGQMTQDQSKTQKPALGTSTKRPKTTTVEKVQGQPIPVGEPVPNSSEILKTYLFKDLKAVDFVMETPTAAIFTLVTGVAISFCVCLVLICRMKSQRKRGRKRNLASDAAGDGDYLVNGMYL